MKKASVLVLVVAVAIISSAATAGIMKYLESRPIGGDIIILSDTRCSECDPSRFEDTLKRSFPNATIKVLDYGDSKGKKLYKAEGLQMLPAVLIPDVYKNTPEFAKLQRFATPGKDYYSLRTGGQFDPNAEICDNGKDDTGNGLVDCADPSCKSEWMCMEKRDKPEVDVFVMSHCPFGTQMEKGLLPVIDLFGDKVDINIRFVDYAMHGKKELDEELNQYCVNQQGKDIYHAYLKCFLKEGKGDACLKEAKVDEGKLKSCIAEADRKFDITKNFNDKNTWNGRFPPFNIHKDLARKYNVRGSPTLVINDVVAKAGRSPKEIRDAICHGFKEKPAECTAKIDEATPQPGFGVGKSDKPSGGAKCGS
jgi:hypothetical protein